MDIAAIRASLALGARDAGFGAWDYAPDDPFDLPAAVVGGIKSMNILTRSVTQAEIGILFYCSLADAEDATRRLDLVLSVGDPDSFLTNILNYTTAGWTSIRFVSAGPYSRYSMPGGAVSLGVEILLEITG